MCFASLSIAPSADQTKNSHSLENGGGWVGRWEIINLIWFVLITPLHVHHLLSVWIFFSHSSHTYTSTWQWPPVPLSLPVHRPLADASLRSDLSHRWSSEWSFPLSLTSLFIISVKPNSIQISQLAISASTLGEHHTTWKLVPCKTMATDAGPSELPVHLSFYLSVTRSLSTHIQCTWNQIMFTLSSYR